jgi:heme/copper-type cytochrome/quinol oxidase subunit 3
VPRGLYVATFTLAIAWYAAAGMAYRAIRHGRVDQHRQWVIRSYVLTLTFVACRMAMKSPVLSALGPEAITAVVWASWIGPLLITEVALQWRASGRVPHPGT